MAPTTPTFGPIAEDYLGFGVQSAWVNQPGDTSEPSNPGRIYANAASTFKWVEWLNRPIKYTSGQAIVEMGSGNRSTRRHIKRGQAGTANGWSNNLFITQGVGLIKAFFGTEAVSGTTNFTHAFNFGANDPQLLTIMVCRRGRWFRYTDCMISTMQLQLTNDEWRMVWVIMGGEEAELDSANNPTPSIVDDPVPLTWGHLISASLPNAMPLSDLRTFTATWNNGLIESRGGGSYHRSKMARGNYRVTGSMDLDYASAAAATQWANATNGTVDIAGTTNDLSLVIGTGTNDRHTILLKRLFVSDPNFNDTLNDPETITVPFEVYRPAGDCTWTTLNQTSGAYV